MARDPLTSDTSTTVAMLRSIFEREAEDVVAAYLFGSVARGAARPDSDVDVAVLHRGRADGSLASTPLRLEERLERVLGRTVQVVSLNSAPADFVHRVLRDGAFLLDRDPSFRIRFEVGRRNEYFDLLPILRRYREGPRDPRRGAP